MPRPVLGDATYVHWEHAGFVQSKGSASQETELLFTSQPQTMTECKELDYTSDLYQVKVENRLSGKTRDILVFINYKADRLVQLQRCDLSFADELNKALCTKRQQTSFLWLSIALTYVKMIILRSTPCRDTRHTWLSYRTI